MLGAKTVTCRHTIHTLQAPRRPRSDWERRRGYQRGLIAQGYRIKEESTGSLRSSFVHTVPSLVFLFTVGVFLYDHNPQINFLKRKWMKNLAKLPSHYVDTSAILWDFLWGVKHQPAQPRIPVDFVYLSVTGACAVALLASVGRPRVVVKLLTTSATLGVENLLRVANNYLHRMKALLPQSCTRNNCFAGISEQKQETILARLHDLVNKYEQNIFLQSQIDLIDVRQRRPMEK
uniref:Uncharacterized protein n=1 Tax=Timema poppense TaxID=170557 RepID=A0A7R9D7R5_TIMPO|nr:unnamed protein product [Timema poppensis]